VKITVVPPTTGGTPTFYMVQVNSVTGPAGQSPARVGECTVSGASGSCTITGLTKGDTYTFVVYAGNSGGRGPASPPSDPVTPRVVGPSLPRPHERLPAAPRALLILYRRGRKALLIDSAHRAMVLEGDRVSSLAELPGKATGPGVASRGRPKAIL
jgi:Fibronectin type III domain